MRIYIVETAESLVEYDDWTTYTVGVFDAFEKAKKAALDYIDEVLHHEYDEDYDYYIRDIGHCTIHVYELNSKIPLKSIDVWPKEEDYVEEGI